MEATKKGFDFKKFMSDNAMWFVLIILLIILLTHKLIFFLVIIKITII